MNLRIDDGCFHHTRRPKHCHPRQYVRAARLVASGGFRDVRFGDTHTSELRDLRSIQNAFGFGKK